METFVDVVGEEDVTKLSNQSNSPEMDNPRTWVSSSVLEISLSKDHHGNSLRCVALHESYPAKSQTVEVRLDITCELPNQSVLERFLLG